MTICRFCTTNLFHYDGWRRGEARPHHANAQSWTASIEEGCTICTSLLDTVKNAFLLKMEESCSLMLDHILNTGVLHSIPLPLFTVSFFESAARDQFELDFRPLSQILTGIKQDTPLRQIKDITLPTRTFKVYSTDYDRLNHSLTQEKHASTEHSFDQIKAWLKTCEQHDLCRQLDDQASFTPTRLLDLDMTDQSLVRLIETNGDKKYARYSTLSHCWGPFVNLRMFRSNLEDFKRQIRLTDCPQNFKDAIFSARSLGISYIWIDSLCIMQGDADDWNAEAPRMHSIYGQSYLNFAAASARNCHEGFFRHRRIDTLPPSHVETRWKGQNQDCKVIRDDFWTAELLNEPLYRRAWVLQERMLSPRTLNFGSRQIFWQCLGMTACESMPFGIPDVISDGGRDELQWRQLIHRQNERPTSQDQLYLREIWRHVVDTYMSCRITVTSDKLPALDGLREKLENLLGEEYFAGLWKYDIAEQLAWQIIDTMTADYTPSRRYDGPSDTWIAPTWSWASVNGKVVVPKRLRQERTYKLEIIGEPHLTKDPKKPLALSAGHLDVEAKLYRLVFTRRSSSWDAALSQSGSFCKLYPDEPLSGKYQGYSKTSDATQRVETFETIVMPLYYSEKGGTDGRALAIWQGDEPDEYKRSGLIIFRNLQHDAWTKFQSETVQINKLNRFRLV